MREELIKDKVYQEVPYQNPRNGLYFELHMDLFPQESGAYGHFNQLFEDAFDTCMETEIQGSKVLTLNPKQHFLYKKDNILSICILTFTFTVRNFLFR